MSSYNDTISTSRYYRPRGGRNSTISHKTQEVFNVLFGDMGAAVQNEETS